MRTPLHQPGSAYRPYHPGIPRADLTDLAPLPVPARKPLFPQHTDPVRECSVCHRQYRADYDAACPVPRCQGILRITTKGSKVS